MSLLGQSGMISYCLGEAEGANPFEPLHVSFGYAAEDSVVTVTCVGSPHSVMAVMDPDDPTSADRLLRLLALTIQQLDRWDRYYRGMPHTGSRQNISDAGYSRRQIHEELWRRAHHSRTLSPRASLWPQPCIVKAVMDDPDRPHHAVGSPESILVVVAGEGLYSYVMLP